jgi:hypothetical protein
MMRHLTFSLDTRQGHNQPAHTSHKNQPQCYSTNVPAALLSQQSDLIEQLMRFARTLGARHLEVYVRDAE